MIVRRNRFNLYLASGSVVFGMASRARSQGEPRSSSPVRLLFPTLSLAMVLMVSCKTSEESKREKELAHIEFRQETNPDPMGRTEPVQIYRLHPMSFTVSKAAFLSERNVKAAKVVDTMGGFGLRIEFDKEGSLLLEEYTSASRGRHIAVFSQWDEPPETKLNKGRWLAAPKIQTHITDGVFIFTPDATRAEAEQIALGLNNVAKDLGTGQEPKW